MKHRAKQGLLLALCTLFVLYCGCKAKGTGCATATAQGCNGPVEVTVTADNGKILSVELGNHHETPEVAQAAREQLTQDIVERQSLAVDTVAGATESCRAVAEAAKTCLLSLGFDEDALYVTLNAPKQPEETPVSSYDVVVVGSGGAGLSAAITAAQSGARVVVLEKLAGVGGNTVRSTALYNCVDDALQHPLGIYDSEEIFFQETFEGGHEMAKPELVRILTSQADEGMRFLEEQGLQFDTVIDNCLGGAHDRGHYSLAHAGTDYIEVLQTACDRLGVTIVLETAAKELIVDDGRVCGVRAVCRGEKQEYRAARGVVLATGGFGYNVEMRMKYDHTLTGDLLCSNSPGSTGDGILMAQAVGANLIGMEYIELYPLGDVATGGLRNSIPNVINRGIFVNTLGERFIREDAGRDDLSRTILEQPDGFIYVITDDDCTVRQSERDYLEGLVLMGEVVRADSLDELADALGFERDVLKATVEAYNLAVEKQSDSIFGRQTLLNALDTPPFYANARKPTVHHTLGGVEIDTYARVLSEAGQPIPGLYAAGEVTGGIHGANRLGGNSFPDIIVFGRIAGLSAAQCR